MADIQTTVDAMALDDLKNLVEGTTSPQAPAGDAMSVAKIQSIVAKLRQIGKYNGYSGIAKLEEIPRAWVLEVDAARQSALAAKLAMAEPMEAK